MYDHLQGAELRLLQTHRIGALIVVDRYRRIVGIVSERDIVAKLAELGDRVTSCIVDTIMTTSVITCSPDDSVVATLALMNKNNIRHIPVVENGEPLVMLSIREFDIACQHLEALSFTDELTGLPNRRYFMGALQNEIARKVSTKKRLSLAMLDLDQFKSINDKFGHDIGDQVLRQLGEILRGSLRGYDVVGRIGGEEFGLLLPRTDLANAMTVCRNVADEIRKCKITTTSGEIGFTASFGLTELRGHYLEPTAALVEADRLLYAAKAAGRDRVISRVIEKAAA
ncbi:MAG: GGDEF domain-containing protein [Pseudomonadota bacterium]